MVIIKIPRFFELYLMEVENHHNYGFWAKFKYLSVFNRRKSRDVQSLTALILWFVWFVRLWFAIDDVKKTVTTEQAVVREAP